MICLCVISFRLALSRLEVGLSIYSRNVIDPRVELVGIVSPLDKVFGTISSTSRFYHAFDDIPIVCFIRDGLNLLFVKFSFNFFTRQVFQNVCRRIGGIQRRDDENFFGPRWLVSLLENKFRLLHANSLPDCIAPLDEQVFDRIQSVSNGRLVLSVNLRGSHLYTAMIRVVVRHDELRQNVDISTARCMRQMAPHYTFQGTVKSLHDRRLDVIVLGCIMTYVSIL